MKICTLLLSFLGITALAVCSNAGGVQGQSAAVQPGAIETGRWKASVKVPGGDIRFDVVFSRVENAYGAEVINGEERIEVGEVTVTGTDLDLFFPAFNSRIEAGLHEGVLQGTLTLVKRGGVKQSMPFRAEYAEGYAFSVGGAEPEIDVTGRWDVTFLSGDGETSVAVGEFAQDGTSLRGTFLTPTGDYRYLSGDVNGRAIELSCFDGSHAFLFKAAMDEAGSLDGDFWSGTRWHERWRARRDDAVALPDPYELTFVKEGYDRIEFSFPDLDGRLVSLDDERFEDRVVIVTLAGSWCPNCHDEAAFLSRYYNDNRTRGLEIVTLMYEHLRDDEAANKQIERFKGKHGIEYTLLYAGYSGKEEAQKTLPMLNHIMSYPTMIFFDRAGEVRRIHTGFSGPATGAHYDEFTSEFADFMNTLLAE